jgi:hypothetical protein
LGRFMREFCAALPKFAPIAQTRVIAQIRADRNASAHAMLLRTARRR